MLCYDGKLSLLWFTGTSVLILFLSFPQFFFDFVPKTWGSIFWGPILYYVLLNMIIRFKFKDDDCKYQIAWRASLLGFIFSISTLICVNCPGEWTSFGIYGCFMSFFHYSEYLAIAFTNPQSLTIDSFMLNHSWAYLIAAVSSWLEYFVEFYFYPDMKSWRILWFIGIALCISGEFLRKLAMFTASSNFNHIVQVTQQKGHQLITSGIYSHMRHPSYVGWFWWSIGTQIILCNPICIVFYAATGWKFFHDRIFMEEITLINFFGEDYYRYQQKVPTGLPFIQGCKVEL